MEDENIDAFTLAERILGSHAATDVSVLDKIDLDAHLLPLSATSDESDSDSDSESSSEEPTHVTAPPKISVKASAVASTRNTETATAPSTRTQPSKRVAAWQSVAAAPIGAQTPSSSAAIPSLDRASADNLVQRMKSALDVKEQPAMAMAAKKKVEPFDTYLTKYNAAVRRDQFNQMVASVVGERAAAKTPLGAATSAFKNGVEALQAIEKGTSQRSRSDVLDETLANVQRSNDSDRPSLHAAEQAKTQLVTALRSVRDDDNDDDDTSGLDEADDIGARRGERSRLTNAQHSNDSDRPSIHAAEQAKIQLMSALRSVLDDDNDDNDTSGLDEADDIGARRGGRSRSKSRGKSRSGSKSRGKSRSKSRGNSRSRAASKSPKKARGKSPAPKKKQTSTRSRSKSPSTAPKKTPSSAKSTPKPARKASSSGRGRSKSPSARGKSRSPSRSGSGSAKSKPQKPATASTPAASRSSGQGKSPTTAPKRSRSKSPSSSTAAKKSTRRRSSERRSKSSSSSSNTNTNTNNVTNINNSSGGGSDRKSRGGFTFSPTLSVGGGYDGGYGGGGYADNSNHSYYNYTSSDDHSVTTTTTVPEKHVAFDDDASGASGDDGAVSSLLDTDSMAIAGKVGRMFDKVRKAFKRGDSDASVHKQRIKQPFILRALSRHVTDADLVTYGLNDAGIRAAVRTLATRDVLFDPTADDTASADLMQPLGVNARRSEKIVFSVGSAPGLLKKAVGIGSRRRTAIVRTYRPNSTGAMAAFGAGTIDVHTGLEGLVKRSDFFRDQSVRGEGRLSRDQVRPIEAELTVRDLQGTKWTVPMRADTPPLDAATLTKSPIVRQRMWLGYGRQLALEPTFIIVFGEGEWSASVRSVVVLYPPGLVVAPLHAKVLTRAEAKLVDYLAPAETELRASRLAALAAVAQRAAHPNGDVPCNNDHLLGAQTLNFALGAICAAASPNESVHLAARALCNQATPALTGDDPSLATTDAAVMSKATKRLLAYARAVNHLGATDMRYRARNNDAEQDATQRHRIARKRAKLLAAALLRNPATTNDANQHVLVSTTGATLAMNALVTGSLYSAITDTPSRVDQVLAAVSPSRRAGGTDGRVPSRSMACHVVANLV